MFKLTKIISSGTNTPEPTKLATKASTAYRIGTALILTDGCLANPTATEKPTFVAIESAEADAKNALRCYPITSNMIFEAPVSGNPATIKPGNKVTLSIQGGFATGVGVSQTNGVATVVSVDGARKSGDPVLVKFD